MTKFKLSILYIGIILTALFSNPAYSQYCYSDTVTVTGELGGETLVENSIIKAENATFSSDGGLIGSDAVILLPSFYVKAGVNFTATVTDCRSTKPYINIPTENAILDNGCTDIDNSLEWYFEWNEVDGATEYQLNVQLQNQNINVTAINTITTNNYLSFQGNNSFGSNLLYDWEATVRAYVNGEWTPWYGSQGEQPLHFSVEPADADCSPLLTTPAPNAVLDNGCVDRTNPIEWHFEWNEVEDATKYQLWVTIPGAAGPAVNQITTNTHYTFQGNYFVGNSARGNWEVSVRAEVDGVWTSWDGNQKDQPLPFSVEPVNTDCPPLITVPLPQATLDNGCNGVNETMTWHFEWTEIEGATEYQLIVEHPSVGITTFNRIVTTNSWTFSQFSQINTYFTDWTVKVRAKVDGIWTDYHGSTLDEEVMLFNVELVNTDCAPLITLPTSSPKATLENGCLYPEYNLFEWEFQIVEQPTSQENEIRIKRPNGSIYSSPNAQIIVTQDNGQPTISYIYRISNEYIPASELENWSVQTRSKINGDWIAWFGHALNVSQTRFNIAPPRTDCAPLITSHLPDTVLESDIATNRNSKNNTSLDYFANFRVYPNPFQQESSISYQLTEDAVIHLGIYNLTGQEVNILVDQALKRAGDYSIPLVVNQQMPAGMYWVRLQVGEQVFLKKLVCN